MESEIEELEFCKEWLTLKKYYFKILTIVTVLADNQKAFRGTLKDLCANLDIQPSSANIQKIKEALTFLSDNEYVKLIIDNKIYTISLAQLAEKRKKIIKIKKTWYKLIRNNHSSASWENTLKIFLILYELDPCEIVKYEDLAELTGLSKRTIQTCVNTIKNIDFEDFKITAYKYTYVREDGKYQTDGQSFHKMIEFSE